MARECIVYVRRGVALWWGATEARDGNNVTVARYACVAGDDTQRSQAYASRVQAK